MGRQVYFEDEGRNRAGLRQETVTIHLYYPLVNLVKGQKKVVLKWEGGKLIDLIEELASRYDKRIKEELLDEHDVLETGYFIFVDGSKATNLLIPLQDEADIIIMTPIPGG